VRIVSAFAVLIGLALTATACSDPPRSNLSDSLPSPTRASKGTQTTATPSPPAGTGGASEVNLPVGTSERKAINQTVQTAGARGSAQITLLSVSTVTAGHPSLVAQPRSGVFTIAELKYECRSGAHPVSPVFVRLRSPIGQDVRATDGNGVAATPEPRLEARELQAGQTARGYVAFDGAPTPGSVLVVLNSFDEIVAAWQL
jgi:hypothetical protein